MGKKSADAIKDPQNTDDQVNQSLSIYISFIASRGIEQYFLIIDKGNYWLVRLSFFKITLFRW